MSIRNRIKNGLNIRNPIKNGLNTGALTIILGIVLVVIGASFLWIAPLVVNNTGLEPQENISIGYSNHFQSVITKFNFIVNTDSQVISIYYNIDPTDKNGFLAIALPYKGTLESNNKKWYSNELPSGSTVIFTNLTCSSSCVTDEDEFGFTILGKLDSFRLPNHYIQLPFSNGISSEVVDEFHEIANGTSYNIGWDKTSTSVQMTLNKKFDERTTEPVARLSLIPNEDGGNNNVLNWNLDDGNTIFTIKYSDGEWREFAEARLIWIGVGIGSGFSLIVAGIALVRSDEGLTRLKKFVKVQRLMQDATTAYTTKDYYLAKKLYDKTIKIDEKNIEAYLHAGNALVQVKRYDDAIFDYKKIIDNIDSKDKKALSNIGACYTYLHNDEKAIEYYEKVLEIDHNYVDALLNMGTAIINLGLLDVAEPYFDEVLILDKNDELAIANKGRIRLLADDHEEAIKFFDDALKLKPESWESLQLKGVSLLRLDRNDEALACFNLILKIKPLDKQAMANKASCLINLGRYEKALECCDECLITQPNDSTVLTNKEICQREIAKQSDPVE